MVGNETFWRSSSFPENLFQMKLDAQIVFKVDDALGGWQ